MSSVFIELSFYWHFYEKIASFPKLVTSKTWQQIYQKETVFVQFLKDFGKLFKIIITYIASFNEKCFVVSIWFAWLHKTFTKLSGKKATNFVSMYFFI